MECVIITVDPEKKRLVLSGREVERGRKEAEKQARMEQFKAGDVVEGTVDSIKPYGAIIKLDEGVDGLVAFPRSVHRGLSIRVQCSRKDRPLRLKIISTDNGKLSLSMKVLAGADRRPEAHETFDYKETGSVSTRLGDLLKG